MVQVVTFESSEERFVGEMRMTWELEPVRAGTRVTVSATDVPVGIPPADHELRLGPGLGSSLTNLARYLGA